MQSTHHQPSAAPQNPYDFMVAVNTPGTLANKLYNETILQNQLEQADITEFQHRLIMAQMSKKAIEREELKEELLRGDLQAKQEALRTQAEAQLKAVNYDEKQLPVPTLDLLKKV